MKRIALVLAALGSAVVLGGTALAAGASHGTLVIQHELRGCHAWSYNGGAYKAAQKVTLARGATLTVVDNDVMPHTLVKTRGPAVVVSGKLVLRRVGASVRVTFAKAGTYRFTTRAGEDYTSGVKTIGEDNVLTLTVVVS